MEPDNKPRYPWMEFDEAAIWQHLSAAMERVQAQKDKAAERLQVRRTLEQQRRALAWLRPTTPESSNG